MAQLDKEVASVPDSYDLRPNVFAQITRSEWENWRWQQQRALRRADQLRSFYPNISGKYVTTAEEWERRGYRFYITPYMMSVFPRDAQGHPLLDAPVAKQFFPSSEMLCDLGHNCPDEYVPTNENWEVDEEMLSPIGQKKYDNRMLVFTADSCLAYCTYCLRSLQVDQASERHGGLTHWQKTLEALKHSPDIEEVILSGGDALVLSNKNLEELLRAIRAIPTVRSIRINTRAFTHNPYRIDNDLCALLKKYEVNVVSLHITHPDEVTPDLIKRVDMVHAFGAKTMMLAQIPLNKGVNDDDAVLRKLFMDLYVAGVKPYYLLHTMPNIPAARAQRTSVRKGVELMNKISRRISHPAMPEYIIVHKTGKKTVPSEIDGTQEFKYEKDETGWPVIRFKNWQGEWQTYLDGVDA